MKNKYGLPEDVLDKIRIRDTNCVYCGVYMPDWKDRTNNYDYATIEHVYPPGNDPTWVTFCCLRCNARHRSPLKEWFKTEYCREKNINENTVAEPIKEFLKSGLKEYYQLWLDGSEHEFLKRCGWIPTGNEAFEESLLRSSLSDDDKISFDKVACQIRKNEFAKWYKNRTLGIGRYYGFEYKESNGTLYRRKYFEE